MGSPFGVIPCEDLARSHRELQHHKAGHESFKNDPIAVWGQLRGAKDLLGKSSHFYRLDHAYYKRMDFFRMTRGDFQPSKIVERPSDRWEDLKRRYSIKLSPWRYGKHVILALSDPRTYDFFGVPDFPEKTKKAIEKSTDRSVIVRKRGEKIPIGEQLKDAWCLVTYASNSVVDALISGVPVVTLGPSIARPVSGTIEQIEHPRYGDREPFFRHMAYCQFNRDEFRNGFALKTADETWDLATSS